ncbi:MAG TPA: hypothetical protein VGJ73_21215 [Verrucomicrobiae bacterium]|jgi:hypothetical protein
MKTKSSLSIGIAVLIGLAMNSQAEMNGQEIAQASAPANNIALPSNPGQVIPSGAPAFNTNGMDFTNVTVKVATGYELSGIGSLGYIQADADLWSLKDCDIGIGGNIALGAFNSGIYSAAADVELIKNLSNFQIVGKAGIGGNFQDNVGIFGELGADINYNLSAGTGWSILGADTFCGAGVKVQASSWLEMKGGGAGLEKVFTVYTGFAF